MECCWFFDKDNFYVESFGLNPCYNGMLLVHV